MSLIPGRKLFAKRTQIIRLDKRGLRAYIESVSAESQRMQVDYREARLVKSNKQEIRVFLANRLVINLDSLTKGVGCTLVTSLIKGRQRQTNRPGFFRDCHL